MLFLVLLHLRFSFVNVFRMQLRFDWRGGFGLWLFRDGLRSMPFGNRFLWDNGGVRLSNAFILISFGYGLGFQGRYRFLDLRHLRGLMCMRDDLFDYVFDLTLRDLGLAVPGVPGLLDGSSLVRADEWRRTLLDPIVKYRRRGRW